MNTSIDDASLRPALERLAAANRRFEATYPGENTRRQPIHVVYGGAHLFRAEISSKLGTIALRSLEQYAPQPATLAEAFGLAHDARRQEALYERVLAKLRREPVEDFRIDFEDGYGARPDAEEDGHALTAAAEVARGLAEDLLPPYVGLRVKSFTEELHRRAIRTLDLFLTALVEKTGGRLPPGFRITIPKVTIPEQVAALVEVLEALEKRLRLDRLEFEIMVETPQSLIDDNGVCALPLLLRAGGGRCVAAHLGAYDYTASCGITAAHQSLTHPACDFARSVMQAALSGTGVWLSDSVTNIMPVGDRVVVHRAWKLHYDHVRRALAHGFYQGWDVHPAQLVARYAALYAFFLETEEAASERLRNFINRAAQATLVGDVFDDAATGQGLLNYFLRGVNCGALSEDDVPALTGLTPEELRSASFVKILKSRRTE